MQSDFSGNRPKAIPASFQDATRTPSHATSPSADHRDIRFDATGMDTRVEINPGWAMAELYALFQEQIQSTVAHLAATHVSLGFHCPQSVLSPGIPPSEPVPSLLHYCQHRDEYSWTRHVEQHPYSQYFDQTFPLLNVVELDGMMSRPSGDRPPQVTYLCAYGANPTQFLLVKTETPLSALQQYCLEQQTQLIKQHIDALQTQHHHHHTVQLLEQTLHRVEHQLRNPLELICLYVDVLHQQPMAASWAEPIQQISKAAQSIKHHLSRIKGYSQSSNLQVEPCRLDALFAEVVDALHPLATEKSVQIECHGSGAEIYVDTWQFKEVLTNLLTNALHFSPPGERIGCQWRVFASEIVIEICDKGPGFSTQDLKKAFMPFYSRRPGGTGLGLTLARKIVLDHQGSLWAENQPTGGASLYIVLPRSVF